MSGFLRTYLKTTTLVGGVLFPCYTSFTFMQDAKKHGVDEESAFLHTGDLLMAVPVGAFIGTTSPLLVALYIFDKIKLKD